MGALKPWHLIVCLLVVIILGGVIGAAIAALRKR
jgi:hypothetical protein